MRETLLALLRAPLDDAVAVVASFEADARVQRLLALLAAGAAAWWIYVPIHELLHVLGCVAGGGTVTRLEIDPIYGAALLQRLFPFVAVGSEYAGQLTEFDPGGDGTYLLTDFLPFALTIFVGVPLLRAATRARPGVGQAALMGAALPVAWAPFVSLAGDYFEMGSIIVSRVVAAVARGFDLARWRSDDLFKKAGELWAGDGDAADAAGLAASLLVGALLALLTYAAAVLWSDAVGRWHALGATRGERRAGG